MATSKAQAIIDRMAQEWRWNAPRERAAILTAEGVGPKEIVRRLVVEGLVHSISEKTIDHWKRVPQFVERATGQVDAFRAHASSVAIAQQRNRIAGMDADLARIEETEKAIRAAMLARRAELPSLIATAKAELASWQLDVIVEQIEELIDADEEDGAEYSEACRRRDWIEDNPKAHASKLDRLGRSLYLLENDPAKVAGAENATYSVDVECDRGRVTIKRKWDMSAIAEKRNLRTVVARELGQNEPDKVDHTSDGKAVVFGALTIDDIDRRIDELEGRKAQATLSDVS